MLRYLCLLACTNIVACTTTQETKLARNPDAISQFNTTRTRRGELRAEWGKASTQDREYCETKLGECEVQVSDRRDELVSNYSTPFCKAKSNAEEEAVCVGDDLLHQGDPSPATRYYKADIWCLEKLNGCVAQHQEKRAADSKLAVTAQRRKAIESSPQGMLWHARVAATSEKVKYIRATLPPDADGECRQVAEDTDCEVSIKRFGTELDGELSRLEAEYDAKKSLKLYEQLTRTEASCYEPELKCLSKSVAKYGETNESRRWLQRNFDLLEKRQRLIEQAGEIAAEPCIESAVANHQADIVQSYRAYVREPVLYFRTQLHRSFVALHNSEIDCLGGGGGGGSGAGATPVAPTSAPALRSVIDADG